MDANAGFASATANSPPSHSRFYGPPGDAAIGAGYLLNNVEYPTFLSTENSFGVVRGLVLVLTHECDLDQENERLFNESALVCPVIPLDAFVEEVSAAVGDEQAAGFVANVTARYVNRLVYIPTIADVLPLGGYLYLNLITNTEYSRLIAEDVSPVAMLSVDGLLEIDLSLERHLRRPKADRVPLQPQGPATH